MANENLEVTRSLRLSEVNPSINVEICVLQVLDGSRKGEVIRSSKDVVRIGAHE